jgi:hypothetical protein
MIKLMGWNFDEWARAAAYYYRINKYIPAPSLKAAGEILREWRTNRQDEPSKPCIIGAEDEQDAEYAKHLFLSVALGFGM